MFNKIVITPSSEKNGRLHSGDICQTSIDSKLTFIV